MYGYLAANFYIGWTEWEILALVHFFISPMYMSFPTPVNPVNRTCRLPPPSPLPRQASYGYMVSNAHHEEVGVIADGTASAPTLRVLERDSLRHAVLMS
jgi:hypothetical protein